jgi:hypothetical protein
MRLRKQSVPADGGRRNVPHCEHFGTGYQLVCWMEETGNWPQEKPTVHSRNPAGRFKMQQAINRHYDIEER